MSNVVAAIKGSMNAAKRNRSSASAWRKDAKYDNHAEDLMLKTMMIMPIMILMPLIAKMQMTMMIMMIIANTQERNARS